MMSEEKYRVPIIGLARHRLAVDGQGVTTLVAFHGCTLRCQYCLNAQCLRADGFSRTITPAELLDEVMIDNLYFLATGGGITFGGGEPAIRSEFIEEFCHVAPSEWHFTIETALNVDRRHLERLLPFMHEYFIDIKDVNPDIQALHRPGQPTRARQPAMALESRRHGRSYRRARASHPRLQHRRGRPAQPLVP